MDIMGMIANAIYPHHQLMYEIRQLRLQLQSGEIYFDEGSDESYDVSGMNFEDDFAFLDDLSSGYEDCGIDTTDDDPIQCQVAEYSFWEYEQWLKQHFQNDYLDYCYDRNIYKMRERRCTNHFGDSVTIYHKHNRKQIKFDCKMYMKNNVRFNTKKRKTQKYKLQSASLWYRLQKSQAELSEKYIIKLVDDTLCFFKYAT